MLVLFPLSVPLAQSCYIVLTLVKLFSLSISLAPASVLFHSPVTNLLFVKHFEFNNYFSTPA